MYGCVFTDDVSFAYLKIGGLIFKCEVLGPVSKDSAHMYLGALIDRSAATYIGMRPDLDFRADHDFILHYRIRPYLYVIGDFGFFAYYSKVMYRHHVIF